LSPKNIFVFCFKYFSSEMYFTKAHGQVIFMIEFYDNSLLQLGRLGHFGLTLYMANSVNMANII